MNGAAIAMSFGMATLAIGSLLVVLFAIHNNSIGSHYHSSPTSTESGTCRGMEPRSDGT